MADERSNCFKYAGAIATLSSSSSLLNTENHSTFEKPVSLTHCNNTFFISYFFTTYFKILEGEKFRTNLYIIKKVIGISGSLIWSKTLMELIGYLTPVVNFCEDRRAQLVKSTHLHVGAPRIFSDLLRSVQMLKRESGLRKATGSYCTYLSLNVQPWLLSLQWKTCLGTELQLRFLRLQRKTDLG